MLVLRSRSSISKYNCILRKKGIKIYGIQHGGSYNLVDYKFLHKVSDLISVINIYLMALVIKLKKKLIDFGSLKSIYYENQIKKYNNKNKKENMTLFVVGAIMKIIQIKIILFTI